jgi:biopolymer transport protein ExbD
VRFARRVRPEVEVNLTPLIDVVFLLLIFFMVSTTFTKESHLSIDLPEGSGDPATTSANQIEVSITKSGDFAINEVALLKNDIETIKTGIQKVSGGDNTIPMIITADGATPHQAVITAMDAAGQLGFVQLSITTKNALPDE